MNQPAPGAIRPRADVQAMFGRIARRYDLMNRLMTGGQDGRWRRIAVRRVLAGGAANVLDVATGTGDLALALANGGARRVVGLDFSPEMIAAAEAKRLGRDDIQFLVGDAMALPFADGAFDGCTVSFGLRNLPDYLGALTEMARVIKPGGRLVCLELTPFRAPLIGPLFDFYFGQVVPFMGKLVSGEGAAYRYLPASVAAFPDARALADLMKRAGFARVEIDRLGLGTVALHTAIKAG
jgi:demethylmenaquinone methyltransferase / 2-methoxy-6-polyprenyl-1,4-benzoquinol methylase